MSSKSTSLVANAIWLSQLQSLNFLHSFFFFVCLVLFAEHGAVGSQSIKLPVTVDLDDPEDPAAAKDVVCYFIVRGNHNGSFSLDPIHHTLRVPPIMFNS